MILFPSLHKLRQTCHVNLSHAAGSNRLFSLILPLLTLMTAGVLMSHLYKSYTYFYSSRDFLLSGCQVFHFRRVFFSLILNKKKQIFFVSLISHTRQQHNTEHMSSTENTVYHKSYTHISRQKGFLILF